MDDFTPMTWLMENAFGLKRLYLDFILPNFNRYLRYVAKNKEEFHAIERKHKINHEGFVRIQLHGLARR